MQFNSVESEEFEKQEKKSSTVKKGAKFELRTKQVFLDRRIFDER
jgi:hypothetical protein